MHARRKYLIVAAIAGVVAFVAAAWWIATRDSPQFHEEFITAMRQECITKAIATATQLGRSGPAVEADLRRRCECAADLAKPMTRSEKLALSSDRDKQALFMAEIAKRCGT